ncbi:MAG: ferrous iron transport protein A [Rhodospirillum sp.]|nr:ferrous iron transport protein A [Rhodospirillum sp.]MCF8488695.1 ferrous iron transport protein A [Rhodospirillum sp.]MCF8501557.1 ferrous iron transport protein A [Rhodospirillum sp.]
MATNLDFDDVGLTLADLRPGAAVTVSRIDGDRRATRDLADLGVRVGGALTIVRRLAGGAVAVRNGGMTVAIGGALARRVMAAPAV